MVRHRITATDFSSKNAIEVTTINRSLLPEDKVSEYDVLSLEYINAFRQFVTALKTYAMFTGYGAAEERLKAIYEDCHKKLCKIAEKLDIFVEEYER